VYKGKGANFQRALIRRSGDAGFRAAALDNFKADERKKIPGKFMLKKTADNKGDEAAKLALDLIYQGLLKLATKGGNVKANQRIKRGLRRLSKK
jgi:hypothetical protein